MPIDPDFLKRYYTEAESRMRWRAEVEYRLLTAVLTTDSVVVAALGVSLRGAGAGFVTILIGILIAIALFALAFVVDRKIRFEHAEYELLGQQIVKIWEFFGLHDADPRVTRPPFLPPGYEGYGKGKGHTKTRWIVWACSTIASVVCIGIGVLASR